MPPRPSRRSAAVRPKTGYAELRALRESGKTRLSTYQVGEEEQIYEEVDEAGYQKRRREKLLEDDFVVDDHGEGYVDNGEEDGWNRGRGGGRGYGSGKDDSQEEEGKGKKKLTGWYSVSRYHGHTEA